MTVGTITGDREVMKALAEIGIRKAKGVIRKSISKQARESRDRVRAAAPVHPVDVVKYTSGGNVKITKKGTLKKAIVAKDRKPRGNRFSSVVRITEGKDVKHDAYYWKFIEHGTIKFGKQPFIKPVEDSKKQTAEGDVKAEFLAGVEAALQAAVR